MKNKCDGCKCNNMVKTAGKCIKRPKFDLDKALEMQRRDATDEAIGFLIIALVLLGSVAATLSLIF